MARKILIAILAMLASACTKERLVPVTRTITVEVPVITKAVPPEALLQCGKAPAGFRFYGIPGTNDIVIAEKDQPKFQAWVNEKNRCLEAWRRWGTTP